MAMLHCVFKYKTSNAHNLTIEYMTSLHGAGYSTIDQLNTETHYSKTIFLTGLTG